MLADGYTEIADRIVRGAYTHGGVYDFEAEPKVFAPDGSLVPLHEGQRTAWESARRIVAIFAGWRGGKTAIGPWWLLREMQRVGPGDYAVVAPNYPLIDNKARPELKRVLRHTLGKEGEAWQSSGDILTILPAGQRRIWGKERGDTRILFRHGTRAEALEAFDGKGVWVDEPGQLEDDAWVAVQARVSIGRRRILLTSRPYIHNWYVRDIWHRVMDKFHRRRVDADEEVEVVNFPSTLNPSFDRAEYDRQKSLMPEWAHTLKFDGIPTKPAGLIYDCFDDRVAQPPEVVGTNVWPHIELPKAWPRAIGLDFGPLNTGAVVIAQQLYRIGTDYNGNPVWGEPTGLYIAEREYLDGGKEAGEHIRDILGKDFESIMEGRIPQPLCAGGNVTGEQGWRGWFTVEGLSVAAPLITSVEPAIAHVYGLVKSRRLVVLASCTRLLWEFANYSRELDDEGERTEKIDKKSRYHLLDALRSICGHFPPAGEDSRLVRQSETAYAI